MAINTYRDKLWIDFQFKDMNLGKRSEQTNFPEQGGGSHWQFS